MFAAAPPSIARGERTAVLLPGLEAESARRGKETAQEIQIAVELWFVETTTVSANIQSLVAIGGLMTTAVPGNAHRTLCVDMVKGSAALILTVTTLESTTSARQIVLTGDGSQWRNIQT